MAFPRRYPPDLVDAVVQRVADARTIKAYGAVTTVARQLDLDPRIVQKWVTRATTPLPRQADNAADGTRPWDVYLIPGLLHCKFCHQPMAQTEPADAAPPAYLCGNDCRRRPLHAVVIADHVGRAILRHAPRIIPASAATPTPPHLAAIHAHRVLAHVTVGATARDITLTWRAMPVGSPDPCESGRAQHAAACDLTLNDPLRARHLLNNSLSGIDPATAPPHPMHAEAATILATLHLRLGELDAATAWAGYAHHSTDHLYGPTHRRSLHTLHLLAAAHRTAGHHQRAYHLYRQLGERSTSSCGPRGHRTLAVHATTALVLHDLGHCQAACNLLADTIATHRREHPGHPATARMTHHLARIQQDCLTKAHRHEDGEG
ncbi:hypothetical protein [Micromonospora sp. WMMD1219]|uniref:hypothetical protein n=1 Tax=Micromonospora sp. WMMD1219 TaxID=3404115 RepID=UPI003BF46A3F